MNLFLIYTYIKITLCSINIHIFYLFLFIWNIGSGREKVKEMEWEWETERDCPYAGSLLRYPQQLKLGWAKAQRRTQTALSCSRDPSTRAVSPCSPECAFRKLELEVKLELKPRPSDMGCWCPTEHLHHCPNYLSLSHFKFCISSLLI